MVQNVRYRTYREKNIWTRSKVMQLTTKKSTPPLIAATADVDKF